MSTGQNYRGFDIASRVGIPCGAGFQPAWSPLRERLPDFMGILYFAFVFSFICIILWSRYMSISVILVNTFAISLVIPIARMTRSNTVPSLIYPITRPRSNSSRLCRNYPGGGNTWRPRCRKALTNSKRSARRNCGFKASRCVISSCMAAGIGTKVYRKGKSRVTGNSSVSRNKSSHEKEAEAKMRNLLNLQRIIAIVVPK